jgi:hypothetical protein
VWKNGSSHDLYQSVKSTLTQADIPLFNIAGFVSDNCSTVMGAKSGFQKLLKDHVPDVFLIGCVCHSFSLCSSNAVKVLPSHLKSFVKDLTSYLARSSKCRHDFRMISRIVQAKENKIPKLSQTTMNGCHVKGNQSYN